MARIDGEIRTKQVYTAALIWVNLLLSLTSLFVSLVPGAGQGGPIVTFGAMPHIVWQIPVIAVCMFALVACYFDSNADYTSTAAWLMVGMWFIIFVGVINIIHLVALCIEVSEKTSTFYLENGGAWVWVLLVMTLVFILWGAWIAWRMYVLRHDIVIGAALGWRAGMLISDIETSDVTPSSVTPPPPTPVVPVAPPPPSSEGAASQIAGMFHAGAVKVGLALPIKSKGQ